MCLRFKFVGMGFSNKKNKSDNIRAAEHKGDKSFLVFIQSSLEILIVWFTAISVFSVNIVCDDKKEHF